MEKETVQRLSLGEFLRLFPMRAPHLMWFLGAGASAGAGIPTAWNMIWEFKRLIYCTEQRIATSRCPDLADDRLRKRIQQFFDDSPTGDYPPENDPSEYEYYFEKAWPHEADRRQFIDSMIRQGSKSFGQLCLAAFLKCNRSRIVWTTNFDHLLEDACAKVFRTTRSLTHANLDNPQLALTAIQQDRWPVLVKLHGDFRSERLKNVRSELDHQDAQLRQAFATSCQVNGLVVAGYSGRDESVMSTLIDALNNGNGFPHGLFWLNRRGSQIHESVKSFLEVANAKGVQAVVVDIENFDEFMADLLAADSAIDDETRGVILPWRSHLKDLEVPEPSGGFPVIRTNALPILSLPATCRIIDCEIGGTKDVRETLVNAKAASIAVRARSGVIAFGADDELKRVFEPFGIRSFDIQSLSNERLVKPGSHRGLLYEAIVRALTRELPLRTARRGSQYFFLIGKQQQDDSRLRPLADVTGPLCGTIPGTTFYWAESLAVRLEFALGRFWLVIEPTVLGSKPSDLDSEADCRRRKEYVRERLAKRYNKNWNQLLDAWIAVLSGGQERWSVTSHGIEQGIDASFEISRKTGFSRRTE